jgi:nitrogen regulatory protein PII
VLCTLVIPRMTVSTVVAMGVHLPHYEVYQGVRRRGGLLPAVRVGIVAVEFDAEEGGPGHRGRCAGAGGAVWVQQVHCMGRIRTDDRGNLSRIPGQGVST